ncbi:hypothetical protein AGDE_09670 [Angomonas deanei]|nr:hypothetical protein AGDE_09670 [Angomonas deanei]|eukprot:EPY29985.1 hypothetical protein AGDE_09670 [Angomonas deanei]
MSGDSEGISSRGSGYIFSNSAASAKDAMQRRMDSAGGFTKWKGDLYAAETPREGLEVIFRVIPKWLPVALLAGGLVSYAVVFRVRLFLHKWRRAERRRAEHKYDLLDNLKDMSADPPAGALETLQDEEGDEDDEEDVDEACVATRDIEEFRSSLGIRLPRDEDLLAVVERMLLVDPIPDGWVLYRTSAGIIRFMNLNTQELFFFPPNKKKEKQLIETELRSRNRQAMESKYSFSYEDEGLNSQSLHPSGQAGASTSGQPLPGPSTTPRNEAQTNTFDFEEAATPEEDASQNSTFKRMFHYFLEKEQRRIEGEVARDRGHREAEHGTTSPSSRGPVSPSAMRSTSAQSTSYRVVSSSTIRGSR